MKFKKIKICYITSVDVTIKFILFNQLKFLKREGYDVYTVCSPGYWTKYIEDFGIKIKNIKIKRKISPFYDLITIFNLYNYFKREKFDIIHTHTPKPGFLGQIAAKMVGVPIIFHTSHGFYFQKNSSYLKRKFFIFFERIIAKCSDIIFFVNKEDMETAVEEKIYKKEQIRYFGGGIDIERFNPARFSSEFIFKKKKQFGINPNNRVIGIVARLVEEKGYLDLFLAFRKITRDFPKTTLLVIGSLEPEKKDAINPAIIKKYKIEKNVIFLGERTDVDEIYALMDIFVLPSYREGLGISIIEASAMGRPVVATNIRGCREAIEDGITGKLVLVGDANRLAETLMYLMNNPKEAEKMGKNGRIKIIKEFDERIIFERIKREYQRLIKEKLK